MSNTCSDAKLTALQNELSRLKLDDSLVFLNHVLGVVRGERNDSVLEPYLRSRKAQAPTFIVRFLAKQLLLHSSNIAVVLLDGSRYIQLQDMCMQLDDPIIHDPNWKDADPNGFFERLLAQQLPAQRRNMLQKYGLALGLFRDSGQVEWPLVYNLRTDIETRLGMSLEHFMAMGHLCYALRRASMMGHLCNGTFDHSLLAEANQQGIEFCVPEVWGKFLETTSCDRDSFRAVSNRDLYRVKDAQHAQFEFNLLNRYPIIDVGGGRFIAVDPDLIIERTTLGLFYDLFERDGPAFAEKFGHVFDQYVGQMLGSVCKPETLWSASAWERRLTGKKPKNVGKIGDWVVLGKDFNVLIECKSLRPSLELTSYGSDESVKATVSRIAQALEQLVRQNTSIQQGMWQNEGLPSRAAVGVIITYGRLETINGPFFRNRIKQKLAENGSELIPFVVLSLEELDMTIQLVEQGHPFDTVISLLTKSEDTFVPPAMFEDDLKTKAISTFTHAKAKAFLDSMVSKR